jgi:hypothetical protein
MGRKVFEWACLAICITLTGIGGCSVLRPTPPERVRVGKSWSCYVVTDVGFVEVPCTLVQIVEAEAKLQAGGQ